MHLWMKEKNLHSKLTAFKLTAHASAEETAEAVKKTFRHQGVNFIVQNDIREINIKEGVHPFSLWNKDGEMHKYSSIEELLEDQLVLLLNRERKSEL